MPIADHKLRVFLCHSSQDKPIVRELYQRLLSEGWIDPWLDEEKLLPGMDWDLEIEKAAEASDVVIVCLSNNSVSKEGYVQRELRFVLDIALTKPEETIFVIPLRLEDCQPPRRLRGWQYADYFPNERRQWSYQRLQQSLKIRLEQSNLRNTSDLVKTNEKEMGTKDPALNKEFTVTETAKIIENEKPIERPIPIKTAETPLSSEYVLSTLSVETMGGVSTPIYYEGDQVPFKKSIVFSTASDNQTTVEVHLVLGGNKMASDNVSLGKYIFDGVSPAKKGVAQIEIQFELDRDFNLNIRATEKSTSNVKHLGTVNVKEFSAPPVKDPLPPKSEKHDYSSEFGDLFEEILGGFSKGSRSSKKKIPEINLDLLISSNDAIYGVTKEIEFQREENCLNCNGSGAKPGMSPAKCSTCNGQGEVRQTRQTFLGQMVQTAVCPTCNGRGNVISSPCRSCQGKGKFFRNHHAKFNVPPHTIQGERIKLHGIGNLGYEGDVRGDVYVTISINSSQK